MKNLSPHVYRQYKYSAMSWSKKSVHIGAHKVYRQNFMPLPSV